MRKISHKVAVSTLRDIITEGEANALSGDTRLAAEGRRAVLLGTVLLQIVSSADASVWNGVKLANYNKAEMADAEKEDAELNKDGE